MFCVQVMFTLPVVGSNGQVAQLFDGQTFIVGSADDFDGLPGDEEYGPKGRVVDADWREVR